MPIGRPAAVGGGLALLSLPVHTLLSRPASVELAAVVLAAVGAVYAGFALQGSRSGATAVELAVAAGFVAAALGGLWLNAWLIPAAYVLHGGWDWLHHGATRRLVAVPRWYPPFCAAYDGIVAAGLTVVWLR